MNLLDKLLELFGHFHPLIVHLPIGFVFFWVVIEFWAWKSKSNYDSIITLLLIITFASSVLACLAGYTLSLSGEYEGDLLDKHFWTAIIFTLVTGFALANKIFQEKYKQSGKVNYLMLSCSLFFLTWAGHAGGSLTHGEDFLSLNFDDTNIPSDAAPFKKVSFETALLYQNGIQPIFNAKCVSCHGASKKKGNLRMDTYDALMKGGKTGPSIISGHPEASELIKLINLEPLEKRAMPPKGKIPLTDEEKELISFWILQGAGNNLRVASLKLPDNAKIALSNYVDGIAIAASEEKLPEVKPASIEAINKLTQKGLVVNVLSEKSNLLDIRVINLKEKWSDKDMELLAPLKENIALLDLSGTAISGKSMDVISKFSNLMNLQIQNTNINDDALASISGLKHLNTLNIYGTDISDKSGKVIGKMPLKRLYTWKSKITKQGIDNIKTLNPEISLPEEDDLRNFLSKKEDVKNAKKS